MHLASLDNPEATCFIISSKQSHDYWWEGARKLNRLDEEEEGTFTCYGNTVLDGEAHCRLRNL